MWKHRILALIILILGAGVAFFVFQSEPRLNKNFKTQNTFFKNHPFRLGLDLSGGSYLLYEADTSKIDSLEVDDQMQALRDAVERRLNSTDISGVFGVAENVVRIEGKDRIAVELPGVTDPTKAVSKISATPLLEFKIEAPDAAQKIAVDENGEANVDLSSIFIPTELTGRYLKRATLEFDPTTREPAVSLQFDEIGTKLFAQITKENIGKMVAIYFDDAPVSTQTIGATLGENAVNAGVKAAIIGFLLITLFFIIWYRLPGLVAILSLS